MNNSKFSAAGGSVSPRFSLVSSSSTSGIPFVPRSNTVNIVSSSKDPQCSHSSSYDNHQQRSVNVKVIVRCRPLSEFEKRDTSQFSLVSTRVDSKEVLVSQTLPGRKIESYSKTFTFDGVCNPQTSQQHLFNLYVVPIVEEALQGFNCTIFAYGQTGTGKTYTMEGDIFSPSSTKLSSSNRSGCQLPIDLMVPLTSPPLSSETSTVTTSDPTDPSFDLSQHAGIIPRAIHYVFNKLETQNAEYSVRVSYLEIYNEELNDLLNDGERQTLRIYEESGGGTSSGVKKGLAVDKLEEIPVNNPEDIINILSNAAKKRRTAETLLNRQSSRSHCIFSITIHLKETNLDGEDVLKIGKLNLVDLAGSENIQRSGANAVKDRAKEAGMINQSLLTLGRVINALVEHASYVPYRDSKLTRLLQESLGGRTKTCIIATISPSSLSLEETLSTLDYAHRAKNIRNRPEINQRMTKRVMIRELSQEIERLKSELQLNRERNGVYLSYEKYKDLETQATTRKEQLNETLKDFQQLKQEFSKITNDHNDLNNRMEAQETSYRQVIAAKDLQIQSYGKELKILSAAEHKMQLHCQTLSTQLNNALKAMEHLRQCFNENRGVSQNLIDSLNLFFKNFLTDSFQPLKTTIETAHADMLSYFNVFNAKFAECKTVYEQSVSGTITSVLEETHRNAKSEAVVFMSKLSSVIQEQLTSTFKSVEEWTENFKCHMASNVSKFSLDISSAEAGFQQILEKIEEELLCDVNHLCNNLQEQSKTSINDAVNATESFSENMRHSKNAVFNETLNYLVNELNAFEEQHNSNLERDLAQLCTIFQQQSQSVLANRRQELQETLQKVLKAYNIEACRAVEDDTLKAQKKLQESVIKPLKNATASVTEHSELLRITLQNNAKNVSTSLAERTTETFKQLHENTETISALKESIDTTFRNQAFLLLNDSVPKSINDQMNILANEQQLLMNYPSQIFNDVMGTIKSNLDTTVTPLIQKTTGDITLQENIQYEKMINLLLEAAHNTTREHENVMDAEISLNSSNALFKEDAIIKADDAEVVKSCSSSSTILPEGRDSFVSIVTNNHVNENVLEIDSDVNSDNDSSTKVTSSMAPVPITAEDNADLISSSNAKLAVEKQGSLPLKLSLPPFSTNNCFDGSSPKEHIIKKVQERCNIGSEIQTTNDFQISHNLDKSWVSQESQHIAAGSTLPSLLTAAQLADAKRSNTTICYNNGAAHDTSTATPVRSKHSVNRNNQGIQSATRMDDNSTSVQDMKSPFPLFNDSNITLMEQTQIQLSPEQGIHHSLRDDENSISSLNSNSFQRPTRVHQLSAKRKYLADSNRQQTRGTPTAIASRNIYNVNSKRS